MHQTLQSILRQVFTYCTGCRLVFNRLEEIDLSSLEVTKPTLSPNMKTNRNAEKKKKIVGSDIWNSNIQIRSRIPNKIGQTIQLPVESQTVEYGPFT